MRINVKSTEARDGYHKVIVDIEGGEQNKVMRIANDRDLEQQLLQVRSVKQTTITTGIRDVTEPAPAPPPPAPTQAELDRAQFFTDYNRLQMLQQLVDCGVILPTNTTYTSLQSKVRSELKAEYLA